MRFCFQIEVQGQHIPRILALRDVHRSRRRLDRIVSRMVGPMGYLYLVVRRVRFGSLGGTIVVLQQGPS